MLIATQEKPMTAHQNNELPSIDTTDLAAVTGGAAWNQQWNDKTSTPQTTSWSPSANWSSWNTPAKSAW
jgi:hypothetical protein